MHRKMLRCGNHHRMVRVVPLQPAHIGDRKPPGQIRIFPIRLLAASPARVAKDAVAAEVLDRGGRELARLAQLVIERLREMEDDDFELPAVAIAGSVLRSVAPVREAMTRALLRTYPGVRILPEVVDPALGALWRARTG